MKIDAIYDRYQIHRGLRQHMLRVTAVAISVADHFDSVLDRDSLVTACLLHDMGNILKSDLNTFVEFFEPEGVEYYRAVKEDFTERYGADEHHATLMIGQELGVSERVLALIDCLGFQNVAAIAAEDDIEKKLIFYSDMRGGPYGILSLDGRMADVKERYQHKRGYDDEEFARRVENMHKIEDQLFAHCSITPDAITDQATADLQDSLRDWDIATALN